jgi:hypothetical protein
MQLIALFTLCFPFLNELLYLFEIDQQIVRLGRGQRLALSTMPLPSASATAS